MSDFVAEVRPRSYVPQVDVPTYTTDEFVAEIRPRHDRSSRQNSSDQCHMSDISDQCHMTDISDQELQTILSDGHFSRERITQILRGSIVTLVEKLLIGQSISSIQGQLNISLARSESPIIVNLNQTFPLTPSKDVAVTNSSMEGSFNVRFKHGLSPVTSCLGEDSYIPFHEFERDTCHSMTEGDNGSNSSSEYSGDAERSLSNSPHNFQLNSSPEQELQVSAQDPVLESEVLSRRHRESDDESGYTSFDKEDTDAFSEHAGHQQKAFCVFNDYYCCGFDGKETVYASDEGELAAMSSRNQKSPGSSRDGSDEMDDEDEDDIDSEHPLVIDENPFSVMETSKKGLFHGDENRYNHGSEAMDVDVDSSAAGKICIRDVAGKSLHSNIHHGCLTETEDVDSPISSDITDTDGPVDFSGDSKFTSDATVPHPQSLVCKHPAGFKCKLCSYIMCDAEAVSSHVQAEHDLYCCTFCCRTFTAKNNLKRHIRIHTGHRPYKCKQCMQSFARRDDLKGHMLRHDYSKPFRCSLCQKGYTDRACVKNHMAKEHRSRLMHVCPQCGESYDEEEAFAAHKRSHPELQQFSCVTCSFIGTNHLMTLKHSLLHTHKLFSCKPCNAYFADPFDYTNHIRKHKKMASFAQFVCCFCDLILSTYDQYIRHEYSHAQGKSHTCRTCKKQFKNKSLLQDHAAIHEEPKLDNIQAEQACSEMILPCPAPIKYDKILGVASFDASKETRFTDDYNNHSCASPITPPSVNQLLPSLPQNEDDVSEGQVLDLTIKKPLTPDVSMKVCDNSSRNFTAYPRMIGLVEQNGSRNGAVSSRSCILDPSSEARECFLRENQMPRADHHNNNIVMKNDRTSYINTTDWNSCLTVDRQGYHSSLDAINGQAKGNQDIPAGCTARPTSADRNRVVQNTQFARFGNTALQRTISQECPRRAPLRFSPYSREKMADLAAKFVAARGTKIFEQRIPLKPFIPDSENRRGAVISELEQQKQISSPRIHLASALKDRASVGCNQLLLNALKENDEVLHEDSNPETALKYRAPFFIKPEPYLEQDPVFVPGNACLDIQPTVEIIGSCGTSPNAANRYPAAIHGCEDCGEEFTSFSQLENHSVEMHKRYLCEHCRKSFTARPNRDRHVRYHTGERPYKCDLCEMAFFRGDDLKYHRTTRHPKAQPFICTHCSASFTWGRDLERHIRHSKCKP